MCVAASPGEHRHGPPGSRCGQAHPLGLGGQLCGGPREAPLFLTPRSEPGSGSINHTASLGSKESPQRCAWYCPNGAAEASKGPWGFLHPPAQDLGEEGCLGHPYQALSASAGAQREQAVQPSEGAQGDISRHGPAARGWGPVLQECGTPSSGGGGLWDHALPSPPRRGHSPLEPHQSIS